MAEYKKGDRIGVILCASPEEGTAEFVGYGTYQGEEIPGEEAVGFHSEFARTQEIKSPRLELDSGEVAWGSEVWWSSEEQVKVYLDHIDDIEEKTMAQHRQEVGEHAEDN